MIKDLVKGTHVTLNALSKNEHKTTPPPRFTEVKLVSVLDEKGIGRPSTFASIVSVIQERGYVRKVSGQQLAPTPLGFAVTGLLTNKFPEYTAYEYTSEMEEELELIGEGKKTREGFLKDFWEGKEGFESFVSSLRTNVDWEEIRGLTSTPLGNGYTITYGRNGAFLQDDNGVKNEKGYLPSAKLDEDVLVEDLLDPEVCKKLLADAKKGSNVRELGVLEDGPYKGWVVTVRDGKFGPFFQGSPPAKNKSKPINHALPEGENLDTVSFEVAKQLFSEVKLPRTLSPKFFVGIGKKKTAYIGYKATPKSRKAVFKSLPEEYDPRVVTLAEVETIWNADK
jgi:DNA topoisomerase-1